MVTDGIDVDAQRLALREWERAEIARSGVEARQKRAPTTPTGRRVVARYAHPPAETAYPWEYAFHLLGDVTGKTVLDLGCGDGQATTLVAMHGGTITAIDISTDLLALARDRCEVDGMGDRVTPVCASAHAVPLVTESVDVVFGMAVLHHLDLESAAAEVHRVLKPGGRAIFTEPIRNSKLLAAIRRRIPYESPDVSPFERPLTAAEIGAFAARFQSIRGREFDLPFVQLLRVCGARASWQRKASASSAALLARVPALRRFASVMVFELRK